MPPPSEAAPTYGAWLGSTTLAMMSLSRRRAARSMAAASAACESAEPSTPQTMDLSMVLLSFSPASQLAAVGAIGSRPHFCARRSSVDWRVGRRSKMGSRAHSRRRCSLGTVSVGRIEEVELCGLVNGPPTVDSAKRQCQDVRVLVADDDDTMRSLYSTLLRDVAGVSSLVDASDGLEAVRIARSSRCQIAILDFNMPRLDGVEAALRLRRERPSTRVVVHSADPAGLEKRAAGLGLAVFDKLDFERLVAWVERQAGVWRGRGPATVAALAPRQTSPVPRAATAWSAASRRSAARCATARQLGKLRCSESTAERLQQRSAD